MKTETFTASIIKEGNLFVSQCLEIDVASQGTSEEEALNNLREAMELYFEHPRSAIKPTIRKIEVDVSAA
jgi:predicted RNase H-like HicB family nuclease